MKTTLPILVLSISCLATGCGKDSENKSSPRTATIHEQAAVGTYKAILRPMNNKLAGWIPTGTAEIIISGDQVEVRTILDDDARVSHMQSIHMGTRCPTEADDKNGDGIIDIQEALKASGNIFIPLDSELNSAEEGKGIYPVGSNFTYIEMASLAKLESDTKQRSGQNLNLGGRVVIIQGVAEKTEMPATVATIDGMTPQMSVPIDCGILIRQ